MNLAILVNILIWQLNSAGADSTSIIEIIKFKSNNSERVTTSQNFRNSDQNGMGQIINLIFSFLNSQALNSEIENSEAKSLVQGTKELTISPECPCCERQNATFTCKNCTENCLCKCKPVVEQTTNDSDFSKTNFDVSINVYTLMLSIGMPCLSIVMIIFTLISLTYCCKSRFIGHSTSGSQVHTEATNAFENPNLSFVYVDFDENYQSNKKEEPPKYNEIFTSSQQVDKLPTYNSFREKIAKNINFQDRKY